MLVTTKVLLGLGLAAGVGTSVALPLGLHYSGIKNGELSQVSSTEKFPIVGGGVEQISTPVEEMIKCSESGELKGETVIFGGQHSGKICWTTKSLNALDRAVSEEQKYSELFKLMWTNRRGDWSKATNYWKSNCTTGKKWTFTNSVGGEEYLGPCDSRDYPQRWVVVTNKNRGDIKIQVCEGECFENSIDSYGLKRLVRTQKKDGWAEVQFQKKS